MSDSQPAAARIGAAWMVTVFCLAAWPCLAADKPDSKEVELRISPHSKVSPLLRITVPWGVETDQNAAPLYAEAARLIGPSPKRDWLDTLNDGGLSQEGERILKEKRPAMDKVRQAARCSKCVWDDPPAMASLSSYRLLSRLVVLQIRQDVAGKRYLEAAESLSAGYALARALNVSETSLISGLVSVAIATSMNEQAFWMLNRPGTPALDFAGLPTPLVDLQPQISQEQANVKRQAPSPAAAGALAAQLKSSHDRAQALAARAESQIDVLRAVDRLRSSVASNGGKLPAMLPPVVTATRATGTHLTAKTQITYKRTSPITATITAILPEIEGKPTRITYRLTLASP